MIAVPTTWHRWWRVLAVLIALSAALLAGNGFRSEEQPQALIFDLRGTYDQDAVRRDLEAFTPFTGKVFYLVGRAEQVCKMNAAGKPESGYCPLPSPPQMTVVQAGNPADGVANVAQAVAMTVLRSNGKVSLAGTAEGSFAWILALLTGGLVAAVLLAGPSLLSRRHRGSPTYATSASYSGRLGVPVTDQHETGLHAESGRRTITPRPTVPPWAPPTPAVVVLDAVDAAPLPELARLVRDTGGRAVARTHAGAPGGYVAVGDVVVWGASSATDVLPGDAVGVEFTGDPAAPLTISPAPEQGYHQ